MPCVLKTCSHALRAYVPTCFACSCANVPCVACLRAHVPCVLTYQRALRVYVLTCLACLRVHVPMCLACLRAHVPRCFACLRHTCNNVSCVLACQCALSAFVTHKSVWLSFPSHGLCDHAISCQYALPPQ